MLSNLQMKFHVLDGAEADPWLHEEAEDVRFPCIYRIASCRICYECKKTEIKRMPQKTHIDTCAGSYNYDPI
jgi:hypothetical protein